MFRKLELAPGADVQEFEGAEAVVPPAEGSRIWLDVTDATEEELELLGRRFGFHPLAIEDCAHFDQRPKHEEFGDYTFLVTHGFGCMTERVRALDTYELHAFLGERYLVTVHSGNIPALDQIWKRTRVKPSSLERGADFLYYLVADALVDAGFPILDRIGDELEALESDVLLTPHREQFARIFELKRVLVNMRRVLIPQRDMISMLARRGDARVSERTALYFRDVHDHLLRLGEAIEANRDLLGNSVDAYLSSVSNRTNEVMKYLTILSAVFLPLSFVVGFFGQNFHVLPGLGQWMDSRFLSSVMVGTCFAVPVLLVWWFRRKGWLE